jgi:hypothetical protein
MKYICIFGTRTSLFKGVRILKFFKPGRLEHICTGQNARLMENMIADAANLGPPKGVNA